MDEWIIVGELGRHFFIGAFSSGPKGCYLPGMPILELSNYFFTYFPSRYSALI